MHSLHIKHKFTLLLLTLLLVVSGIEVVKGQRVYADAENHSTDQKVEVLFVTITLSSVKDAGNAVDASDLNNFSTLSANLGALSLIEAWQNVKFTGVNKPTPGSPISIRFAGNNSLIGLINGISIQPSLDGTLKGTEYQSSVILDLLSSLGTPSDATISLPAQNIPFDGLRFKVSATLLGLAITGKLYYVFFIVPPTLNSPTICSGSRGTLTVSNAQHGYTYKWYTSITDVNPIQSGPGTTFTTPTNLTATTTYYVEAVDNLGGTYYSARVPITVTVNSISPGSITTAQAICSGTTPTTFTSNSAADAALGTSVDYQWQKSSIDNMHYTDISGAIDETFTESEILTQNTYYKRIATTILNGVSCSAVSNELLITVNPKLPPPHIDISSN